jgi:hypothetical protein
MRVHNRSKTGANILQEMGFLCEAMAGFLCVVTRARACSYLQNGLCEKQYEQEAAVLTPVIWHGLVRSAPSQGPNHLYLNKYCNHYSVRMPSQELPPFNMVTYCRWTISGHSSNWRVIGSSGILTYPIP